MDVLWLGDGACGDPAVTGGKAATLSALAAEHPVPLGFCVRSDDAAVIAAAYAELGERLGRPEPAVAVRSSALGEDGAAASFAGQYRTLLNVCGAEAVANAVRACVESGRSERARAYRSRLGLGEAGSVLPVLVQEQVLAEAAAVAFSVDPVTGERGAVRVEACWGLGSSLVNGMVNPDSFVVGRADLQISERRIADKRGMTVAAPGGVREIEVPDALRRIAALSDERVRAAAELAVALEERQGAPVDVEYAWQEGRINLLQCRPVTRTGG